MRSHRITGYWEVSEGFGGPQEFWGVPALGGLPELARGETLGVPRLGGVPGLGVLKVGESWEFNQHLSQSILHCISRGFSTGRKDGQAGQYLFLGREG